MENRPSKFRDWQEREDTDDPFGAHLRELRQRAGYTQVELAAATGLKQSHISAMEHGTLPVGMKRAERLANALNVEPDTVNSYRWFRVYANEIAKLQEEDDKRRENGQTQIPG